MSYLVFARKWRPQNFDQVIGQEHIATTLKNAISLNRVAHAYLFAGPRGIGKTSTARILAKALNCEKGPIPEPCNSCSFCLEISQGRSLDVIEIDGASNRGIEQIRQLRQNVKLAPAKNRFKVYIIDEVHQITTDGFNALLKTLEEPPAHVKFIFATTEAYKVLPTILSRCQRFDFRPLSISYILEKLKRIVKAEGLDISEEALLYIARAAVGSMRDAESILDQLSSFSKEKITLQTVSSVLGMIGFEPLWEIVQKIIARETKEALILLEKIINEGKDLFQLTASLMDYFRNILIAKITNNESSASLIDLPQDELMRVTEQAKALSMEEILYIFSILTHTQGNLRRTLSARVIVEMAIVKLTQRGRLSSLEDILKRLTTLEQNLTKANPASLARGSFRGSLSNAASETRPTGVLPTSQEVKTPKEDNSVNSNPQAQNPLASGEGYAKDQIQPHIQDNLASGTEKASSSTMLADEELSQNWPILLEAVKEEKVFVASSLELGQVTVLQDKVLTVGFPEKCNFYKETLERPDNKKFVEAKAKEIFRRDLKVRFVIDKNLHQISAEQNQPDEASESNVLSQPIVQFALETFKGRIIKRS